MRALALAGSTFMSDASGSLILNGHVAVDCSLGVYSVSQELELEAEMSKLGKILIRLSGGVTRCESHVSGKYQ